MQTYEQIEEWKTILDYPGYQVSNEGRVRSIDRKNYSGRFKKEISWKGKELKRIKLNNKYWVVNLSHRGTSKLKCVHHLVLTAFAGPRLHGALARHEDDNGFNANIDNLYWGTHSDNMNDRYRNAKNTSLPKS